jgi:hypothetical protein
MRSHAQIQIMARCGTVLVSSWIIGMGWAQEAPPTAKGGLQVRSVSVYFDYYSAILPTGGGFPPPTKLLSDADGGGSVQLGWVKSTERSTSSLGYTSSYTGRIRYSEWNAWNHSLTFGISHKIAPRWTFGFSAAGDISTRQQSLFSPTTFSNAASVPASFNDLASGILASKFTNPQLASVLASAPLAESPVRNLLYGERVLTSSAQTSLSYSYSTRLSMIFSAGGGRMQTLPTNVPGTQNRSLITNTTSGNASLGMSYSLAPRTQVGGSVTTTRISSSIQDAYITTSIASLGWTVARKWLIQIHGGVGVTNPVRQGLAQQAARQYPTAGGTLGFKTFSHTLLGSFDRGVGDQYGLGASTSSSASGSWHWERPGRPWWIESTFTWQHLYGNGLSSTIGWRTFTGFGQRITKHFAILTQYAYLDFSGRQQAFLYGLSQSAVRVSVIWNRRP